MAKINKLETTEDIEKLYQKFLKRTLAAFRAGDSVDKYDEDSINWLMKKTGLGEEEAAIMIANFLDVLKDDTSINQNEMRKEK